MCLNGVNQFGKILLNQMQRLKVKAAGQINGSVQYQR